MLESEEPDIKLTELGLSKFLEIDEIEIENQERRRRELNNYIKNVKENENINWPKSFGNIIDYNKNNVNVIFGHTEVEEDKTFNNKIGPFWFNILNKNELDEENELDINKLKKMKKIAAKIQNNESKIQELNKKQINNN